MNPKEKAKELVERMNQPYRAAADYNMTKWQMKQCAIICVDEIIKANPIEPNNEYGISAEIYWQQVKTEIELL